jgi:CxxC motif-containing protein (DUF1111 family)
VKFKTIFSATGVLALVAILSILFVSRQQVRAGIPLRSQIDCPQGCNNQPPPPPPPGPGVLGGPYAGLNTSQTSLFNTGYSDFAIKWDPDRGLGPVFTDAGCFNCHGGGNNVITQCTFNPPGVPCVYGGSSNVLGTRYGKWNSDGTFNYLDGTGTFPENEGGPTLHNQTVAQFDTLTGCSTMMVAASPAGATESGTTVTITTTAPHNFQVGQTVTVAGVAVSAYNGAFSLLTIPSSTTFTYTDTGSALAASGGGSAFNMPHEVVPKDATVVNTLRSTQLYGLGLVDSIPDSTIEANATAECQNKGATGICGVANMVPDQNGNIHVGRFGQKANIPNLLMFTAFAFNNEIGITNAFFPVKHLPQGLPYPRACDIDANSPQDVNGKDFLQAYQFNELLAPVAPQPPTGQTLAGQTVFNNIGCNICHIQSMTTGPNIKLELDLTGDLTAVVAPLSNATANLYSDLLLHDLGPGLTGGIPFQPEQEGQATLTEWRTAPLWGLSTRVALGLLHDNRAKNINEAILDHGGEAAVTVIPAYQALDSTDNANLLAFLGSL